MDQTLITLWIIRLDAEKDSQRVFLFADMVFTLSSLSWGPEPPFTGLSGPSRPEIAKKSQKRFFFWGGLQESPKNTRKNLKMPKKGPKIGRLFGYFLGLVCRPQKRPFLRLFFAISGPGGPETPVNAGSGRNP